MDKFSDLIRVLLAERKITTAKDAEAFLNPDYELHTHNPFLMLGMESAVERTLKAIESKEKIAIYSDFDADGIPGGVLLYDFLKKIGYTNFTNYIPHRNTEGYGFHKEAVEKLAKEKVSLIITVDVGITDAATVEHARKLGVDCIITDHHEPNHVLPNAVAVLNPKQKNCQYPFRELCGTGVAYKLVQALITKGRKQRGEASLFKEMSEGWEKWLLDLVAIATVADMVPLVGENRVLAKWGLTVLHKSRRPGIRALCKRLGMRQHLITENDIGFMIAPRINAASRMDDPEDAFNLLATESEEKAIEHVRHLEKLNNQRKGIVAGMVRELKKKFAALPEEELPSVIVTGKPEWSPALLGLAAGSIADEFNRPVCLWGREGTGVLKGSCRSNGTVNIVEMLEGAGDKLLGFGGHEAAGGFSVSHEEVHTLPKTLEQAYKKSKNGKDANGKSKPSASLLLSDACHRVHNEVSLLAPFGIGNTKPIFEFKSVKIDSTKEFGKEKNHIEVMVSNETVQIRAFTFFAGKNSFTADVKEGKTVNLLATIGESSWNGRRIELRIIDIV